jgi:O-antigen chain-terminating methyltransferase
MALIREPMSNGLHGQPPGDPAGRLEPIVEVARALEAWLGRPLRVLDLGCAQGFLGLGLAALGASVLGVDGLQANVDFASALARERPELDVAFRAGWPGEVIPALAPDAFDLVLGVGAFDPLLAERGADGLRELLAVLAGKTLAMVLDLASLPECRLPDCAFVHELGRYPGQGGAERSLRVASDRVWVLDGRADAFESWTFRSHPPEEMPYDGTRRYYSGHGLLAKLHRLDHPSLGVPNLQDHEREVAFLSDPAFPAPRLLLHGRNAGEVWLVRERIPGELLAELITSGRDYDPDRIILDILDQLAALEATGRYHEDLRTFNILVGPGGDARIIDFGALSETAEDCDWPQNLFLSFMILAYEILNRVFAVDQVVRTPILDPEAFPEPYRSAFVDMLNASPGDWRFATLRDRLREGDAGLPSRPRSEGQALALKAMSDVAQLVLTERKYWQMQARLLDSCARRLEERAGEPS